MLKYGTWEVKMVKCIVSFLKKVVTPDFESTRRKPESHPEFNPKGYQMIQRKVRAQKTRDFNRSSY